jgi:uncharacterized repeat protein (TIGR01451 family)
MKQKIMICLVAVAAFFMPTRGLAQGWDKTFTSPLGDTTFANSVIETRDSGFVFAGGFVFRRTLIPNEYKAIRPLVVKTDKNGNVIWRYMANDIYTADTIKVFQTADNGFLVLTTELVKYVLGLPSILAIKLNSNGVEQSRKYCLTGNYLRDAAMSVELDQIAVITQDSTSGNLLRLSSNGDSISNKYYKYARLEGLTFGGDRQMYVVYTNPRLLSDNISVMKVDSSYNLIWARQRNGSPRIPSRLKRMKDGRILVSGGWKLDYDGTTLWGGGFTTGAINLFSGYKNSNKIALLNVQSTPGTPDYWSFISQDSLGTFLGQHYFLARNYAFEDIIPTSDGGFMAVGKRIISVTHQGDTRANLIKLNGNGYIFSNSLKGKVFADSIQNCRLDATEKGLMNRLISVEKGSELKWAITDSLGNYEMQIDTGNYLIRSVLPNQNWRFCTPSVSKQILTPERTDTVNFAMQALVNCPQMRISTSTQGSRRCFDNNFYQIRYTNEGTQAAQNAFITLKLDSLLEYVGASRRLSSRVGQMLTFNLGTVPIGFDDQFSVQVRVKCGDSTRLGQSLCTEARIFPDTVCIPAPNWSGANIVVSGRCDRDSVRFLVQNIGTGASSNLRRQIVEDEIVFLNGTINVPASSSRTISVPANGKTWRLNVDQEPNNPLSNQPTAVVEGCRTSPNQPISTGFVNQFPTDDGSPTIDNVCAQIVGAFDPNDKEGLPQGYKNQRFINQNQAIDYRIRFQNTGNDTAFTVVLRDTLSDFLDISSLKIGASSHKYTWSIEGKNVLVFRFDNIKLVDSFRNESASHGFVAFKINQKKDVALGSIINNQADIYFDYNAPIRTNKTVHTIGKDFIVNILQINANIKNVQINVYPNPFTAQATLDIQGLEKTGPLSILSDFTLFDAFGRQLRSEKFNDHQFVFERQNLGTGIYFFKIENGGKLIGTGKFLIQ